MKSLCLRLSRICFYNNICVLHFIVHVVSCYRCAAHITNYCWGNQHHKQLPLSNSIPAFSKNIAILNLILPRFKPCRNDFWRLTISSIISHHHLHWVKPNRYSSFCLQFTPFISIQIACQLRRAPERVMSQINGKKIVLSPFFRTRGLTRRKISRVFSLLQGGPCISYT